MKWLNALFGKADVPKSRLEPLFALSTAQITIEAAFNLRSNGRAGLVFRTVESQYFTAAAQEIDQLLQIATRESGTEATRERDRLGFEWIVLRDEQIEDLVAAAHLIGETLQAHGFGDWLLAAAFGFARPNGGGEIYLIYNYKRASFYPFAPTGDKSRDNALELRLGAVLQRELPVESDESRWYPLWGAPV